jgi:hypothetical protein
VTNAAPVPRAARKHVPPQPELVHVEAVQKPAETSAAPQNKIEAVILRALKAAGLIRRR